MSRWAANQTLPFGPQWGDPDNGRGGVAACMAWDVKRLKSRPHTSTGYRGRGDEEDEQDGRHAPEPPPGSASYHRPSSRYHRTQAMRERQQHHRYGDPRDGTTIEVADPDPGQNPVRVETVRFDRGEHSNHPSTRSEKDPTHITVVTTDDQCVTVRRTVNPTPPPAETKRDWKETKTQRWEDIRTQRYMKNKYNEDTRARDRHHKLDWENPKDRQYQEVWKDRKEWRDNSPKARTYGGPAPKYRENNLTDLYDTSADMDRRAVTVQDYYNGELPAEAYDRDRPMTPQEFRQKYQNNYHQNLVRGFKEQINNKVYNNHTNQKNSKYIRPQTGKGREEARPMRRYDPDVPRKYDPEYHKMLIEEYHRRFGDHLKKYEEDQKHAFRYVIDHNVLDKEKKNELFKNKKNLYMKENFDIYDKNLIDTQGLHIQGKGDYTPKDVDIYHKDRYTPQNMDLYNPDSILKNGHGGEVQKPYVYPPWGIYPDRKSQRQKYLREKQEKTRFTDRSARPPLRPKQNNYVMPETLPGTGDVTVRVDCPDQSYSSVTVRVKSSIDDSPSQSRQNSATNKPNNQTSRVQPKPKLKPRFVNEKPFY